MVFSGVLHAVLTNPRGALLFIVAAIGSLIFAGAALILNLPVYKVNVNSAIGGAALAIAGIFFQIQSMNQVRLPEEKWVPARAA